MKIETYNRLTDFICCGIYNDIPTLRVDMEILRNEYAQYQMIAGRLEEQIIQLKRDAMIMALRLYGENTETFSPETLEVMKRWNNKCLEILENKGEH